MSASMAIQRYQFSMRALVLLTVLSAIVSGMAISLPIGQFPFEVIEPPRPLTLAELVKRLAFLAVAVGVEIGGLLLLATHYKRLKKQRAEMFSKQHDNAANRSPFA
jgi:hypothetical protein